MIAANRKVRQKLADKIHWMCLRLTLLVHKANEAGCDVNISSGPAWGSSVGFINSSVSATIQDKQDKPHQYDKPRNLKAPFGRIRQKQLDDDSSFSKLVNQSFPPPFVPKKIVKPRRRRR